MGGAATKQYNTQRVNAKDINDAINTVSKITGLSADLLFASLLGSTRLTLIGKKKDSGDIDIGILDDSNREKYIKALSDHTKVAPRITMGSTYSWPLEVNGKNIQLDFIFVADMDWAKFCYHDSEYSAYKSGVRNELLHAMVHCSPLPGQDIRIYDDKTGLEIAKASRSYNWSNGFERIFRIAPIRKDGKGRVKGMVKATAEDVQKLADNLGIKQKFSHDSDLILDPDEFAHYMFGPKVDAKDVMRSEQIIALIETYPDKEEVFKFAIEGMKNRGFDIPKEIQQYA